MVKKTKDGVSSSFILDVETQTGEISEPNISPLQDGHIVKTLYTAYSPDRKMIWIYDTTNGSWDGVEIL